MLLAEAAQALIAAKDPGQALDGWYAHALAHLGAHVMLHHVREGDALRLESHRGLDASQALRCARLALGEGLCGRCARTAEFVALDQAGLIADPDAAIARDLGLRCYAAAPLLAGGKVFGTVAFGSRDRDRFDDAELDFVRFFGWLLAAHFERRARETVIEKSEASLRAYLDHATDAMFLHSREGAVLDVNKIACESLGYTREELLQMFPLDFDPVLTPEAAQNLVEALDTGAPQVFESQHRRKDGTSFPVEVRLQPFWSGGERFALAIVQDITQRQMSQRALRDSEQSLQRAQAIAQLGDWSYDVARHTIRGSLQFRRLLGWAADGASDRDFFGCCAPEDLPHLQSAWNRALRGASVQLHFRVRRQGGATAWMHLLAEAERGEGDRVQRLVGVLQDVTRQHELEEQLRHTQKMETMGQLAAGIAHEFNNALTVINGFSDLLLDDPLMQSGHAHLRAVREAGERAVGLTRQLLAFGRKQILSPRVVEPEQLLAQSEQWLRRLIGEDYELSVECEPALQHVRVDPGPIEQAIVNLVLNARDAMPQGGRILLRGRNVPPPAGEGLPTRTAGYVAIEVRDAGSGMTRDVRERAVEPFFTTKAPGSGTGLGLAIVHGIVEQSGGTLRIDSAPGSGTVCQIFLPACGDPLEPYLQSGPADLAPGSETVLLVEDDPGVRALARIALEEQGYRVIGAEHGAGAMRRVQELAGPIHLLLTDVVMPGESGRVLADALRAEYPGLRVLFMTGYADEAMLRHGVQPLADRALVKPFTARDLAAAVRSVLDGPAGSAVRVSAGTSAEDPGRS